MKKARTEAAEIAIDPAEIERLAAMHWQRYDQIRLAEARRLGVPTYRLDAVVYRARAAGAGGRS